jgi:hypothetical protein
MGSDNANFCTHFSKSCLEKQFKERPNRLISKLKECEKDIINKLPNHLRSAVYGNQQASGLTYADYVREKNHFYDNKLTGE